LISEIRSQRLIEGDVQKNTEITIDI